MKSLISIMLLGLMFAAGSVCAQGQAPSFPCQDDERFAEFDFWVGAWEVHVANGTFAGNNEITRARTIRHCLYNRNAFFAQFVAIQIHTHTL